MELWRQVLGAIENRILDGSLKPGDRLESEEELAVQFGASRQTVHKAIQELKRKGLVDRKRRWGTTISAPPAEAPAGGGLVALLFDYSTDYPQGELIRGVAAGLQGSHRVVLADSNSDSKREADELANCRGQVEGIVAYPSGDPSVASAYQAIHEESRAGGPPLVFIDRCLEGLDVDSVASNNHGAVRSSVEWAISNGRRRIAFVSGDNSHVSSVKERRQGYVEACEEAGIYDPALTRWIPKSLEPQPDRLLVVMEDALFAMLRGRDPISALFCTQDVYAVAALEALSRMGAAPGEVEVITYNDWPPAVFPRAAECARIIQPVHDIGRRAVELLLQRLAARDLPPQKLRLESEFLLPVASRLSPSPQNQ